VSVVVTRNRDYVVSGGLRAASLPEALALTSADPEPFVIGGEQLFREALPWTGRLYLTEVLADFPGDAWFPQLAADEWKEMHCEHHPAVGHQPAWDFRIYERATAWRKPEK